MLKKLIDLKKKVGLAEEGLGVSLGKARTVIFTVLSEPSGLEAGTGIVYVRAARVAKPAPPLFNF